MLEQDSGLPQSFIGWKRQAIEERIQATQASIRDLQDELLQLHDALNRINPLSTLPQEVLSEILSLGIDEGTTFISRPRQFDLGAVCRAWRRIIWSQSTFWKTLDLLTMASCSRITLRLQLLREWIDRSGSLLLDLRLPYRSDNKEPSEFYDLLFTHAARWERLQFSGGSFPILRRQVLRRTIEFPSLRELIIETSATYFDGYPWTFISAPNLRKIDLPELPKHHFDIDWSNLIEVKSYFGHDEGLFVMNAASTCLQTAFLNLSHGRFDVPKDGPHVLPCLTLLDLTLDAPFLADHIPFENSLSSLLRSLTLPALEDLTIDSSPSSDGYDNYIPALIDMIRRSKCQLKSLDIGLGPGSTITESGVIEVLREVSSLTQLQLNFDSLTLNFSDAMVSFLDPCTSPETSVGLPNLLSFTYTGDVSCSFLALKSMILGRMHHVALPRRILNTDGNLVVVKLKTFHVEYPEDHWITQGRRMTRGMVCGFKDEMDILLQQEDIDFDLVPTL